MQILYFKPSQTLLIRSLLFIALIIPGLSFAYGGRHYSNYYGHYGYHKYGGHSYYPYKYYRRHRYGYSYRRYQKYPKSYFYSVPVYTQLNTKSIGNQYSTAQIVGTNSPAWPYLINGQYNEALNTFAEEAQSHPNSGVPKVGYALAIAFSGNLDRGIWAMRRAFRIDPDSLHYLELDEKGHLLIDNLIGQYSTQENDPDLDHAFMVSALYYLKHDYAAAKISIASAQQYGDKSSSFINLQRLIDQQLAGQENVN